VRICLLGSASKGNALYIEHRGEAILIDQGFSLRELKSRFESRSLDISRITGIIVTHEHSDHINGVGIAARSLGIPVYGTPGTLTVKKNIFNGGERIVPIESGEPFKVGPFEILPYKVSHDAADPVQYVIRSGRRKIAVATDLGFVSKLVEECLRDSEFVVLEANHDVDMLKKGPYPWELKQRIMSRVGHLSNRNAAEILFNISSTRKTPQIILAHLSEENNLPELAEKEVRDLFERFDRDLKHLAVALQDVPTDVFDI